MKKSTNNLQRNIKLGMFFSIILILFSSCKDYMAGKLFQPSNQLMMDEYIMQEDTSMSEFLKIADIAGFRGLLHAYGTNTCFVPTNSAIQTYCKTLGIATMETLPVADLEKFIKFHLVRDTIQSRYFIDGRLGTATMLGKFLTTKTVRNGAQTVIRVNRQADILQNDIVLANGILNKINNVLVPNPLTVGEMIDLLPENYSLFKSIMKKTGLTDSLTVNKADREWYTVFLQSNESFATQGITDLPSLLEKLKIVQPDFADNPAKLEELYAQYHCIKRLAYVSDLSQSTTEITLAKNQVLSFKIQSDSLLVVNEFKSLTKFEKGVEVDKHSSWTDMSCYNGVLIDLLGYIQPVKRGPEAIYWEWSDQPEIKQMSIYRKKGSSFSFKPGELADIQFGGINSPVLTYGVNSAYDSNGGQYAHYDFLFLQLRSNVVRWVEITTPVLTEGTYNVWICYRRGGSSLKFKSTFKEVGYEDQLMPNVVDLGEYYPNNTNPDVNLANGWKRYNAKYSTSVCGSRNAGAIKVDFTGRHILRWDALGTSGASGAQIDMIQFIPVEQNQVWPRFDVEGNAIYPGTPCEQIAPLDQSCSGDLLN